MTAREQVERFDPKRRPDLLECSSRHKLAVMCCAIEDDNGCEDEFMFAVPWWYAEVFFSDEDMPLENFLDDEYTSDDSIALYEMALHDGMVVFVDEL